MKLCRGFLVFFVCAAVLIVIGCVSALKSAKPQPEPAAKDQAKSAAGQPRPAETAKQPMDEELKKLLAPPPPPQYSPPPPTDAAAAAKSVVDPVEKEQVSRSALSFASHMKNVKHVKVCYSKLYGGWYLMLYLARGKKTSLDQYSWNKKSQEWEIVFHLKEIPQKQVEYHLKGEVGDEKCFVLK
ncbi:MAG: hypothetical protein ACP5U1_08575 [Desulfomonilaceae bacterium]